MSSSLKDIVEKIKPRGLNLNNPVVQVFFNKSGIQSSYTFTHFPSLYSPKNAGKYYYDIKLFDSKGKLVGRTKLDVNNLGTINFEPSAHFGSNLPEHGMMVANIKPKNFFYMKDNHLGMLTSHFYVMFRDKNSSSIGLVHPQARIKKPKKKPLSWVSNQIVETRGLKKITNIQINPTKAAIVSKVTLINMKGEEIDSRTNILAPMGTAELVWENFAGNEFVTIKIDKLTAPNAKPLMFLHFEDGSFSVSHS